MITCYFKNNTEKKVLSYVVETSYCSFSIKKEGIVYLSMKTLHFYTFYMCKFTKGSFKGKFFVSSAFSLQ